MTPGKDRKLITFLESDRTQYANDEPSIKEMMTPGKDRKILFVVDNRLIGWIRRNRMQG